ncbi:MAG: TetR/AcrR family transcriptional regulator [Salinisphaeraceae bacterium]|nr:TetR/AcrR family transcriptional regulator [Salinisphaeraceae bacterium]
MIKTRSGREQALAEREKLFIEATRQQLCNEGLLGIQMAAIARSCNFATGTLYHHFASKEDLLIAVCTELTGTRQEYFRRVAESDLSTREKMLGFAVAYTLFAQHHPEHFRLEQYVMTEVVWLASSTHRREQMMAATMPIGRMVESVVVDAIEKGELQSHGKAPLTFSSGQWAMSMGMHTLINAEGVLDVYALNDPYRMLMRHIELQLNAMEWQPVSNELFDDDALDAKVKRICDTLFGDLCGQHSCIKLDKPATTVEA